MVTYGTYTKRRMNMKKTLLTFIILTALLPNVSTAQSAKDKLQADKKTNAELKSSVKKWGEATLIMKDDKGNVILNRTEKYPIIDPAVKAVAFDNCWNWCRNVCDGYGVCWVSCGWHCSPWTK